MLLLRRLWNESRVPNCIRLAVFGNLYLRDTVLPSVLLVAELVSGGRCGSLTSILT